VSAPVALLKAYEHDPREEGSSHDSAFRWALATSLGCCLGVGSLLLTVDVPAEVLSSRINPRRASFILQRKPSLPPPEPVVEDLTESPLLGQAEAKPPTVEVAPPESDPPKSVERQQVPEHPPAPRRVYGVRRVFSRGLGAGGGQGGGIVSKRGNTLEKEPDTLTATEADLAGTLAPLSTVTSAPVLMARVKPEYTEEMIEHGVAGLVQARLLVDIDGTVKDVHVTEDIGYGSRGAAAEAFRKLRFKPARRGDEPVAVWIVMKYRFVLQR